MAKDGISKFKQVCGLQGNEYLSDMWTHYSDVDNHLARKSLNWRSLLEAFTGETPDLSVLRFKFFEPIWYREWSQPAGEINMFKGRFLGIAWNVGDAMCYRIIFYRNKREEIINRSVCVPRDPDCDVPPPLSGMDILNMFPKLTVEKPKTSPPAISGGEMRLDNEPAKRLKANAGDDTSRGIIDSMSPGTVMDDQSTSIRGRGVSNYIANNCS